MRLISSLFNSFSTCTDEELMLFLGKGKEKAFDELYKRYSKRMLYFFYRQLSKDNQKAQDFLQDLFLKLIQQPQLFNPNQKFIAWFYTIATNMCKNEYRKVSLRGIKVVDFDFSTVKEPPSILILPDKLDQHLFSERLENELDNLEEGHRLVFILRYKEDLSIKEISQIVGCPEGTVKSRLFYTVQRLSLKLEVFNPHKEVV